MTNHLHFLVHKLLSFSRTGELYVVENQSLNHSLLTLVLLHVGSFVNQVWGILRKPGVDCVSKEEQDPNSKWLIDFTFLSVVSESITP